MKIYFVFSKKLFYEEIEPKRNMNKQMRLQTDLEFQQREIMKLNKKYNVLMFGTKIRGGKGFAAEQKISGFFSKSTVDPSYCFLCVDLFSSKVYVYPMKNNFFLVKNFFMKKLNQNII